MVCGGFRGPFWDPQWPVEWVAGLDEVSSTTRSIMAHGKGQGGLVLQSLGIPEYKLKYKYNLKYKQASPILMSFHSALQLNSKTNRNLFWKRKVCLSLQVTTFFSSQFPKCSSTYVYWLNGSTKRNVNCTITSGLFVVQWCNHCMCALVPNSNWKGKALKMVTNIACSAA